MVSSRSEMQTETKEAVSGFIRLATRALGAVSNSDTRRQISAGNVTAGIRGTGVYLETRGDGTYFCTCWGAVELGVADDPSDFELVESTRHAPRLVAAQKLEGTRFRPAPFETHTDQEMDIL